MPWTNEQRIEWRLRHPEWKPKPRSAEQSRKQYLRHKAKTIKQNWVRQIMKLGCTPELYVKLNAEQEGLCALCRKPNAAGKKLAVDHDHKTGIIRGLLCNGCNTALGTLGDNVESIVKVLNYICRLQK